MKIFIVLFCFFICLSDLGAQSNMIYPLHVGDCWQYMNVIGSGSPFIRKVVGDTLMSNGFQYFVIVDSGASISVKYQRLDGNKVYQYGLFIPNEDQLIYEYFRTPGERIATIPMGTDTSVVFVQAEGFENVFGTNQHYWIFCIDYDHLRMDDEIYHTVIDSIGVSEMGWFGGSIRITGALINGCEYGYLTNVQESSNVLPARFQLKQNYPNPFNPSTTIEFNIPEEVKVTLVVFDILGREVMRPIDGVIKAGYQKTIVKAEKLSTGVYFYRMTAGSFSQTRNFLLLK